MENQQESRTVIELANLRNSISRSCNEKDREAMELRVRLLEAQLNGRYGATGDGPNGEQDGAAARP